MHMLPSVPTYPAPVPHLVMHEQQVSCLVENLAAARPLVAGLKKYETNFTPAAKATVQRANESIAGALSALDSVPKNGGIAGWLLEGKPACKPRHAIHKRAYLGEAKAAHQSVLASLTALLTGGIPLPRSTKEELTQLKDRLQAWRLAGVEEQEQLARSLQQLYVEASSQGAAVDIDAVESRADTALRSVLQALHGCTDLTPEVRPTTGQGQLQGASGRSKELKQELELLEQAVGCAQGEGGTAAMLGLALNSLQRLHASHMGGDEGDDSDSEAADGDDGEEDDEDDPFYMPLPSAALKWADEKKFKLLAMPLSSAAEAADKPMLELEDAPSPPKHLPLAVNVQATPGLTAADYEPLPPHLQSPGTSSANGQATPPHLSPTAGRQAGAPHTAPPGEESAPYVSPIAAEASDGAACQPHPADVSQGAAKAADAGLCAAPDSPDSCGKAASGPLISSSMLSGDAGSNSRDVQQAADAFAAVRVSQPAVTAPGAGARGSGPHLLAPLPGREDASKPAAPVPEEQQQGANSTAGRAELDTTPAVPPDEKQKQFVDFLQASNQGPSMFHAQMRLSLDGCRKLAAFLASSARVRALSLSRNYLGDDGMQIICDGLRQNSSVTSIDLPDNNISDSGCITLVAAIQHNRSLTQLQLAHNKIGDEGAIALAALIASSPSLKKLGLANNNIGKAGCQAMTVAIRASRTLKQLQLLPASQPAATEPGPSTPPPAKRTKAEQAAEPSQPTRGASKGQSKAGKATPAPQPDRLLEKATARRTAHRVMAKKKRKGSDKKHKASRSAQGKHVEMAGPLVDVRCGSALCVPALFVLTPPCVLACQNGNLAWLQVIKVPEGAVLRGCKKTRRKLREHLRLRTEIHSQLRVIASLFVLRIFLTCLVGYPTPGSPSAPQPPAPAPAQPASMECDIDSDSESDCDSEPEPQSDSESEPEPEPVTQPPQRRCSARLAARAPAAPTGPPLPLDCEDPLMLRQLKDFCKFFANPNFKTCYNQLQRRFVRNRHPMLMPAFEDPSNQALVAKLQELGSIYLAGDANTIDAHSMQLAVAMQQHYANPGKWLFATQSSSTPARPGTGAHQFEQHAGFAVMGCIDLRKKRIVKLYAKAARAKLGWSGEEAQLFIRMACGYGINAHSSELKAATLDKGHVADLIEEANTHRRLLGMKKEGSLQDTLPLPRHSLL
ncbi:hypothetical protein QJQ45_019525 [Haematococcus lacustris]|nr:hypothetical protein QJQ45_019525 [Haematococcus lacustris]